MIIIYSLQTKTFLFHDYLCTSEEKFTKNVYTHFYHLWIISYYSVEINIYSSLMFSTCILSNKSLNDRKKNKFLLLLFISKSHNFSINFVELCTSTMESLFNTSFYARFIAYSL